MDRSHHLNGYMTRRHVRSLAYCWKFFSFFASHDYIKIVVV